ncbi:transmembrane ascorbate ferrireductase 2 [Physcomitrium patens]|nr:probable transmembrane ascorbate ferrireductase 2 [Physcomitrium patens]XP_024361875.1 probable transmembrane ascorbate ferrireductase 2 [Physcomitrium patens]PNR28792.1 hypothetical protein PHYPA_027484 [Physcomitrium patens]|eukprot:XP_024361874.1 probable transmembrane ascorbate ferrireductase 2 [Physcomitrella patens]
MATYSGVTPRHLAPLVHLLGIVSMVLMALWTKCFRGGYGLSGSGVFNLHPLIMFAGFIFLSSEAIVTYKILSGDKKLQKRVHMIVQGVAIFLAVLGVTFAYKFHLDIGIQNFYSLHSWLGLITITLYLFQWILGFMAFWQQSVAKVKRAELLPWHVFLGLAAYATALATAELGLLEKVTFLEKSESPPLRIWSGEAMLVNIIGIVIFLLGAFVVLTSLIPRSRKDKGYRDLLE